MDTFNSTLQAAAYRISRTVQHRVSKRAGCLPARRRSRSSHSLAALLCLAMLWALCGCARESSSPSDGEAAKGSSDQPKFEKIADSTPVDAKARVERHLDLMISVSESLVNFCPEQGRDLNELMDLVEADFDAVKGALDTDQTEAIKTKYVALSDAMGRCISDGEGRRFSQRLVSKLKPLTVPN